MRKGKSHLEGMRIPGSGGSDTWKKKRTYVGLESALQTVYAPKGGDWPKENGKFKKKKPQFRVSGGDRPICVRTLRAESKVAQPLHDLKKKGNTDHDAN